MSYTKVLFEVYADDTTYGVIVDQVLDAVPTTVAISINFLTPASASSPTLSVTLPRVDQDDLAKLFGAGSWDEFIEDRDADVLTID